MSWKCKFLKKFKAPLTKKRSFSSIFNLSSQIQCLDEHSHESSKSKQGSEQARGTKTYLSPEFVKASLNNCPSDLVALSFFLWCARQPNYFHDRATFGYMGNVVCRLSQRFGTVKGIIEELEQVGCVPKPQTLLLLLRIYWHGGMNDMVFEVFGEMLDCGCTPNTFVRNMVMDVSFKIGRVDVALTVLKETQEPNFLTFSIAVCNLFKRNDLINLRVVLRTMLGTGYYLNPENFSTVLSCYCRLGRVAEALQLWSLMTVLGVPASVRAWSILIDGLCKCGRINFAGYLLQKMFESGCSPNVVTFTPLIKGLLGSEMPDKAFEILRIMELKGYYPDLVLYNVLIDCLSKMGRYDDALDVFFSLRKQKLLPDAYTFCSLMSTVCSSKQFVLLPVLISDIPIQPDLVVCNSLLSYFCKAGYPVGAVEFYNDMIDKGFVPDRYTFAGLLCGLCMSGRTVEAVDVYHGMVRSCLSLDDVVHTVVIDGLVKSGKFHTAIRLFKQASIDNFPMDVVSYTVAINGLIKGGRASEGYNLFSQMKEVGVHPNIYTYNVMLSSLCRDRDFKMIRLVLQEMIDEGIELDSYTLRLIKSLLYKSRHSELAANMIMELSNSGLLPKKAYFLFLNELDSDAKISYPHIGSAVNFSDFGRSCSDDDLFDVAASVG